MPAIISYPEEEIKSYPDAKLLSNLLVEVKEVEASKSSSESDLLLSARKTPVGDDDYPTSPGSEDSYKDLHNTVQQQEKHILELQNKVQALLDWRLKQAAAAAAAPVEQPVELTLAEKILNIIRKYGHIAEGGNKDWDGKAHFLPIVERKIEANEPIRMVLPAFPFKSPNRTDKVLGRVPDLGEELALATLQGIATSIQEIYPAGGQVCIASDGLVYNDLLGVPNDDVWAYGDALRKMAVDKEFDNIKFYRLHDLLDIDDRAHSSEDEYLAHAGCVRREFLAKYGEPGFDWRRAIRENEDSSLTYRGYLKFLAEDMKLQPQMEGLSGKKYKGAIEAIAQKMIVRGKAFANAIQTTFDDCVRLSIHESTGSKKLPIPLVPQDGGGIGRTPWHSSIAVGLDGSYRTVRASDVRETHDLILRDGLPYCFREKSDAWDWGNVAVEFEHLYPQGLLIKPKTGSAAPSMRDIPMQKVRQLAQTMSPVVIRGFADTLDRELYHNKAREAGEIQEWTFGAIQEVRDSGRRDKMGNNVVSNEAMPMHFDGMFKFVTETDADGNETRKQKPPRFQFFTCKAVSPKGEGYTLFASSRLFWRYLPQPFDVERLERITWGMDNDGFWDAKMKNLPLVVRHPVLNTPCMRWHEPWPASKTKYSTCDVFLENDTQDLKPIIDDLLYDPRVCYRFSWNIGDVLVSDNISMLHTRTAFRDDTNRELWRIHFD